jgi:hypothetical protein
LTVLVGVVGAEDGGDVLGVVVVEEADDPPAGTNIIFKMPHQNYQKVCSINTIRIVPSLDDFLFYQSPHAYTGSLQGRSVALFCRWFLFLTIARLL